MLDTLAVSAPIFVRMFPSIYLLSQSVSFKTRLLAKILKYFHSIGKNWADLIGIVMKMVIFYNNSNELCLRTYWHKVCRVPIWMSSVL